VNVPYHPPLSRLLTLGKEPAQRRAWPNYLNLGLQPRHVSELIRMATDASLLDDRSRAGWGPLHAWRALGQLEAAPAAAPLFALLERELDDPVIYDELPIVLGMIGPPALPTATLWLFDETRAELLRIAATRVLAEVAHEYPDRHDEAAAVIVQQLQDWPHQSGLLNGFLISFLAELGETSAAPLMEAAYAADAVDLSVAGDWEDVQVDLGLLEERITPSAEWNPSRTPRADAAGSEKARRKAAKQARKRNRR
jgi:hypothetical protein